MTTRRTRLRKGRRLLADLATAIKLLFHKPFAGNPKPKPQTLRAFLFSFLIASLWFSAPANACTAGTIMYNGDYHVLQYCNGTTWKGVGRAPGAFVPSYAAIGDISDANLVGWWKFDETSGTSAADATGNGNTGTLTNGPTFAAGYLNNAVSLDGTNDYVTVGSATG